MSNVLEFPAMAQNRKNVENLPNRVRELRLERGLTLKVVAEQVGLALGHLQRIETGKRELTLSWMHRIARALEVTPADLLNYEDGGLDRKERHIVETRRQIPEPHRQSIDAVAEAQQAFRGASELVPLRAAPEDAAVTQGEDRKQA